MSDEAAVDHSEIKSALGSIGLSAMLILGATFLSQGLGFITRITMARYLPVDGYGNVVLGISIMNLLGIVALSGLPAALSRYIPRKETDDERRRIVVSAFHIVVVVSLFLAVGTFLLAEPVSRVVFDNPDLVWVFRIFALVLPFYALFKLSVGGFRGYEKTKPQVVTDKVLLPGLQLLGIVAFVTLGYDTAGIAFAYAVAFGFVGVVSVAIVYRLGTVSPPDILTGGSIEKYRELLTFSIPLAASGAINTIAKHSDLVILGIFRDSGPVGVYELAFRMSFFVVAFFSPAVGYLFQPLVSKFDADNEIEKMDQLFTVTTRWIVVATFPVFALMFLFPEQTLTFFFGGDYSQGALALSILVLGFMISRLPGLTSGFLTATGKTKTLMYISVGTAVVNIVLNIALIPAFGILGAAIATASARLFNNITQSIVIVREFGMHPFKRDYVLPSVVMGSILIGVYVAPLPLEEFEFYEGFIFAAALGILFLLILLLTRSIYAVEVQLIDTLVKKSGIPISVSTRLQQFVR